MACSTTLGKRARSKTSLEHAEHPAKRSKRLAAVQIEHEHDENWTPDEIAASDDDDGDDDDDDDDDDDNDSLEPIPHQTPSKPRRAPSQILRQSPFPITPQTPRHRDVFAKLPSTPRHAVMSAGKLFRRLTPSTPFSPSSAQTIYHSGRQLFARGADPGDLVGRDSERRQLGTFLARLTTKTPGGCLYVSGAPGTGKSAMVQKTAEEAAGGHGVRHVYINCMSVKSSKSLYDTILQAISTGQDETIASVDAMSTLQTMFLARKGTDTYLLVLDEIDHILTMGLESLYKVFGWSLQKASRLALVGIANALDLTDRHLPRLKAMNLRPELLPFMPYSSAQIKEIITSRLRKLLPGGTEKLEYIPLIHPAAIELCARKVSNQTGDLRRAFEVCRRVLDLIEKETRDKHEEEARESMLQMTPSRKPLGENANLTSPGRSSGSCRSVPQMVANSLKGLTAENAPRASIGHLNKVTAAAFSNGTNQRLKALNLQQKAALCALIAKEQRTRAAASSTLAKRLTPVSTPSKAARGISAPTIRMLYQAYAALCTRDAVLHPLSASEFREVISSLETLGLVQEVDGKTGSLVVRSGGTQNTPGGRKKSGFPTGDERRVASCVAEKEMEQVVSGGVGEGILKSILGGEALD